MKTVIAATLAITAFSALADDAALIAETKKTALAIPPKLLQMVQGKSTRAAITARLPRAASRRQRWPPPRRRTQAGPFAV
jgi:hypothetical protein